MVIRTDITGRIHIMDMLGRHSIGRTDTAFIIGITDITGTGGNRRKPEFKTGGRKSSPVYFLDEPELPGDALDEVDGEGSVNSFFKRSCISGSCC